MTSKKRRQRGSRTHGGGSHKNRRGAGNRGGRGNAGRDKHEFHNYGPLGKKGFKPVNRRETETANIREINEDISEILMNYQGIEEVEGIYEVPSDQDAMMCDGGTVSVNGASVTDPNETRDSRLENGPDQRDVRFHVILSEYVEEYDEADQAKLLASGQVEHPFTIELDDCSRPAKRALNEAGGQVYYIPNGHGFIEATRTERVISSRYFSSESGPTNKNQNGSTEDVETLEEYLELTESGNSLRFSEFEKVVEAGSADADLAYEVMRQSAENLDSPDGVDVVMFMLSEEFGREFVPGHSNHYLIQEEIDSFFGELEFTEDDLELFRVGMPEELSVDDVLNGLDKITDKYQEGVYQADDELRRDRIHEQQQVYLSSIQGITDWDGYLTRKVSGL